MRLNRFGTIANMVIGETEMIPRNGVAYFASEGGFEIQQRSAIVFLLVIDQAALMVTLVIRRYDRSLGEIVESIVVKPFGRASLASTLPRIYTIRVDFNGATEITDRGIESALKGQCSTASQIGSDQFWIFAQKSGKKLDAFGIVS